MFALVPKSAGMPVSCSVHTRPGHRLPCLTYREKRGPTPREVSARLSQVRSWRDALVAGSRGGTFYDLTERSIGGPGHRGGDAAGSGARHGIRPVVAAARGGPPLQAFEALLARTRLSHPALLDWVVRFPLRALAVADHWPALLAAYDWLLEAAGRGATCEITAPGVDTKFVEAHTRVLGEWLDAAGVVASDRHPAARRFARRYGFAEPPPSCGCASMRGWVCCRPASANWGCGWPRPRSAEPVADARAHRREPRHLPGRAASCWWGRRVGARVRRG